MEKRDSEVSAIGLATLAALTMGLRSQKLYVLLGASLASECPCESERKQSHNQYCKAVQHSAISK